MANEITIKSKIELTNGDVTWPAEEIRQNVDQTNARVYAETQNIGTSHEALTTGSLTAARWARFKNADATNYVEIGVEVAAAFHALIKLKAGEMCDVPVATNSLYAQANTAAVELVYILFDD